MDKEKETNNNGGNGLGQSTTNDNGTSGGRIRSFPQGFSKHKRLGESGGRSEQSDVPVDVGNSELLQSRKTSNASDVERDRKHRVGIDGTVDRINRTPEQPDRGVRNPATNNGNNATRQRTRIGAASPNTGDSGKTQLRELLQEQLKEREIVSESPAPSVLDLDTEKPIKLNHNVEIVPTTMMQREIERNQSMSDEIELQDDIIVHSAPALPKKKGRGRPSKNAEPNTPIKTDGATTKVVPAEQFKFDNEIRQQLNEVIVYGSKLLDMGIDYGLGVDTSQVPIWEFSEDDAAVFVRILERRAARSEVVRDKIVPKMLAGRDYIEAGMIVMPRAFATIQQVVDNGGIKPHIVHKKEG